ncbi:MAG: substrate-binding domain-containing protein [Prolixibacteraceae bacterium]
MNKFFAYFSLSVLMIFSLFSCTKDNDNDSKKEKVAVLLPSASITPRWADDAKYLQKAIEYYGYEVKLYTAENTAEGAVEQVGQLRQAIADGITNFVITAIDYALINESGILEANQDCNFICHDRIIYDNAGIDFFSACDPSKVGVMQAQFLLQSFRASGKSPMTIELFAGPLSDGNAILYYEGAYGLLKPYIDNGSLVVKSGKKTYNEIALPSWTTEAAENEMASRLLNSYAAGEAPDMILAANDNTAAGIINATVAHGFKGQFPIVTGQDNNATAKQNIANGRQGMTIDKGIEEMAYNSAMILNSYISGNPAKSLNLVNNGAKEVPTIYSSLTLVTIDNL